MYSHLFRADLSVQSLLSDRAVPLNPVGSQSESESNLTRQQYDLRPGSLTEVSGHKAEIENPNKSISGTSNNPINALNSSLTRSINSDYLLEQKLRNSGLYSKLKNKTIYSKSEFVRDHERLNSGIL